MSRVKQLLHDGFHVHSKAALSNARQGSVDVSDDSETGRSCASGKLDVSKIPDVASYQEMRLLDEGFVAASPARSKSEPDVRQVQKTPHRFVIVRKPFHNLKTLVTMTKKKSTLQIEPFKMYPLAAKYYDLKEELGKGTSATVWRAHCTLHSEDVAAKLVNLDAVSFDLSLFAQETATMNSMRTLFVVPLYAAFIEGNTLWMLQPLVDGGDLSHIMDTAFPEGLEEDVIATVTKMVLRGLHYIHEQGYVHRDIKAANLLVDRSGRVLIADFTVAKQLERRFEAGDPVTIERAQDFAGTIAWMAPEIIEGVGADCKADIWSLGMTIIELAHGQHPWLGSGMSSVMMDIVHGEQPSLPTSRHWSHHMKEFLDCCFEKDADKRLMAQDLLKHPWVKHVSSTDKGMALIKRTLVPHVLRRSFAITDSKSTRKKTGAEVDEFRVEHGEEAVKGSASGGAFTSPKPITSTSTSSSNTSGTIQRSNTLRIMSSFLNRGWSLPKRNFTTVGSGKQNEYQAVDS